MKTRLELENRGYQVDFVPTSFVAEVFAEEFVKRISGNECILFPKGNLARDVIPVALREIGISLDELIVYGTKANVEKRQELIAVLEAGEVDVITFTSPSTVTNFVRLLDGTNWREWTKKMYNCLYRAYYGKRGEPLFSACYYAERVHCRSITTMHL